MKKRELLILVTNDDYLTPQLLEGVRMLCPDAKVIGPQFLAANPEIIAEVEVALGRPDPALFPRAKKLRWVQTTFAGMERYNVPEVKEHPVVLTNARIHAVPVSEHAFGLLLMLTRKLFRYGPGRSSWEAPALGEIDSLPGKMLCIVGFGTIAQRCAELGKALGMRVIAVRRHPKPAANVEQMYGHNQLHEALSRADVVMNILPLAPDTDKLFDHAAFQAMRFGAYFINVGRGRTVDTDSLVEALRIGKVSRAALDVVDPEPLPPEHVLWAMPNVLITPHYGGSFAKYVPQATDLFLENLKRYLAGEPLACVVDKSLGY